MKNKQQSFCPTCGGSGQISFFKGESRFLLSTEECPACCGFGYVPEEGKAASAHNLQKAQESEKKQ